MSTKILSLRQTCAKTSLSRTYINVQRAAGKFPKAIPLGEKRIGFIEAEIDEWLQERIDAARSKAKPRAAP